MAEPKFATESDVEEEIARLLDSTAVRMAQKAEAIKNRRRRYMYQLRCCEKKGLEMLAKGITMEDLESMFGGEIDVD